MQIFENLLLQNYSTEFLDSSHKKSLSMCNSGSTNIIIDKIAKDNLNIANLMQTFEKSSLKIHDRIL